MAIIASVAIHLAFLSLRGNLVVKKEPERPHRFKIDSIRTVGKKNQNKKNLVYIPKQVKTKNVEKTESPKGKDITLSDLSPKLPSASQGPLNPEALPEEVSAAGSKPIQALSLDNNTVKKFLQNTPNASASGEYAKAFGQSNVLVDLEVPDGVPEDELNQYELVFYSFRKRTALNYINSFYNELNDFSSANPHLRFPMTKGQESMTGRITYDEQGNIVRIKMLKWTNKEKLQEFFLQVLKNMNSLPNPPEIILKDGEFHVYYSLTVNG